MCWKASKEPSKWACTIPRELGHLKGGHSWNMCSSQGASASAIKGSKPCLWVLISSSLTEKGSCWYQHACYCLCSINHKHTPWSVASPQSQPSYLCNCGFLSKGPKEFCNQWIARVDKARVQWVCDIDVGFLVADLCYPPYYGFQTSGDRTYDSVYTNQFLIISHPHFPAHCVFSSTETPHVPVTPEPASFSSLGS